MPKATHLLSLLLFAATSGACGTNITFHFDGRPMPPPPRSSAEACYQQRRFEVAGGSTEMNWSEKTGSDGVNDYYIVHHREVRGLTFYQGGQRIDPQQALAVLQDPALEQEYNKKLEEYRVKATRDRAVGVTGVVLSTLGLGVMLSSLAFVDFDATEDSEQDLTPVFAMLGAGGALTLTGSIIWWAGLSGGNPRFHYELRSKMFPDTSLVERLAYSLLRYNRLVANSCGYAGPVDIPMPAHFKALAAPSAPRPTVQPPPPPQPQPPPPSPPPQPPPPPELDPSREIDSLPTEE